MQVSKFEESLLRASGLMLVFAHELEKNKDLIASGYYSFNAKANLNKKTDHLKSLPMEAFSKQKLGNSRKLETKSSLIFLKCFQKR